MPNPILKVLRTMWPSFIATVIILALAGMQPASATTVVNFAPGVEASPTGLTPGQIRILQTANFNTLILFSITVQTNGDFSYGGGGGPAIQLCAGGVYVGPANWGNLLNQCQAPPSSINRIEMCIGGWLDQSFLNIKNLIAANGSGSNTILYKNLSALKNALGLTAMDYDEEYEYDAASAIKFGQMCGAVGMKVTFCPYTDAGYWQAVKSGLGGTVDFVYLQCYAGGEGNDAATWSGYFNNSVPVLPGDWDADEGGDIGFLKLMQAGAREGCIGGWFWPNAANGTTASFALKLYPNLIHFAFDPKTNYWQGATADYNIGANWTSGAVPGANLYAINDTGSNNIIQINTNDPVWNAGGLWAGDGTNATGAYIQNGASVEIVNPGGWMRLGANSGSAGYYTLNAGALNLTDNLITVGENGTGVLNINGGSVSLGNVVIAVNSGSTGTANLNGVIDAQGINGGSGSSTVNFNGVTIKAAGDSASFMGGISAANILAGGLIFDSQGFDVTVSQGISGSNEGLTKVGSGTLRLSGYNTFTGSTVVNAGTLAINGNNDVSSALSYTASLTINSSAAVSVMQNNTLFGYGNFVVPVYINTGGVLNISAGITAHIKGSLTLNGGTLDSVDTGLGGNGTWNLDQGTVTTLGGATTSTINAKNVLLANPTVFNIPAGATNGIDLNVSGYFSGGGVVKSGTGVMQITGTNTYSGTTTISAGLLQLGDGINSNGMVSGNITDNATLVIANPLAQNFTNTISGSGTVIKNGGGKLTLSKINGYSGSTLVNFGTLALTGSGFIGGSTLIAISNNAVLDVSGRSDQTLTLSSGRVLRGSGTLIGKLNALSGSTVNPGDTIGTLTVQSNITLNGTLVMELNRTNVQTCDQLVSTAGTIIAGGALTVTNTGLALQAGDTFHLFGMAVGGFATINLPALPINCFWTNTLAVDGTIKVLLTVSTVPTNITAQVANDTLTLSWPMDHTGWRLQTQTNSLSIGLNTNWVDVANSTNINQSVIPINPTNGSVFFRLVYPYNPSDN